MFSTISSDQFAQKYTAHTAKSVQTYSHSMHIPHWNIEQGCNCPHKNTVTAQHPTAFQPRRRNLVKTRNVRIFVLYWHKMCFALTFS